MLKQWLSQKRLFVKRNDPVKRPVTHLLMDGGNLSIPPDLEPEFLSVMEQDAGPTFVVEKKTEPHFHFFVDIDLYEPEPCPRELAVEYMGLIVSVLCEFYAPSLSLPLPRGRSVDTTSPPPSPSPPSAPSAPEVVPDGLLCMAESTPVKGVMKTGIHAIFRGLIVDVQQCMVIRQAIIKRAGERYGERGGSTQKNPWEEVFDPSVYKANGLRMVGCHKMEPCPRCTIERRRKSNRGSCSICKGRLKHDVGRVYAPLLMIDQAGQGHPLPPNFSLLDSSIRLLTPEDRTPGFTAPEWLPTIAAAQRQPRSRRPLAPPIQADNTEQRLDKEDPRYLHLAYLLRHRCGIPGSQVVDVTARKGLFLIRTTSHECHNRSQPHKTARIFFLVSRRGMQQRCFCKCDKPGVTGQPCKDSPLPRQDLSRYSKNLLFSGNQDPNKLFTGHAMNPIMGYSDEDKKYVLGILDGLYQRLGK